MSIGSSLTIFRSLHICINKFLLLTVIPSFLFLILTSGCAKKAVQPSVELEPAPAVKLDPVQQTRIDNWHKLMRDKRDVSDMEKLDSVNRFFNHLEFVDDYSHWGKMDYWSTPVEFLTSNGGDCEDFATAKYFTLLNLHIPDEQMRLVYVKSLKLNQPHMVLSYYTVPTADPLVLDSLMNDILPASMRSDLIPVYSFNGEGLWLAKREKNDRVGDADRLSLWQELQKRMQKEAIAGEVSGRIDTN
jgi:predicted transglutaminase-like cysteine proteinase